MYWPENTYTEKADPATLAVAKVWLSKLYTEAKNRGDMWIEPHITADYEGDVIFECWHGEKSIMAVVANDDVYWTGDSRHRNVRQQSGNGRLSAHWLAVVYGD